MFQGVLLVNIIILQLLLVWLAIHLVRVAKTAKVVNNVPLDIPGILQLVDPNFVCRFVILVNIIMEANV